MSNQKKPSTRRVVKTKPTICPMGFGVSQVESSLIVINFIDEINNKDTIIESIALPKEKAEQLADALLEMIKNDKAK